MSHESETITCFNKTEEKQANVNIKKSNLRKSEFQTANWILYEPRLVFLNSFALFFCHYIVGLSSSLFMLHKMHVSQSEKICVTGMCPRSALFSKSHDLQEKDHSGGVWGQWLRTKRQPPLFSLKPIRK